jgi:predicted  nucleic acid-binding Zn-ribbon protein
MQQQQQINQMSSHVVVSQNPQNYLLSTAEFDDFKSVIGRQFGAFYAHQETTDSQLKEAQNTIGDMKTAHGALIKKTADNFDFLNKKVKYTISQLTYANARLDRAAKNVADMNTELLKLRGLVRGMENTPRALVDIEARHNKVVNRLCEYDAAFVVSQTNMQRFNAMLESFHATVDSLVKSTEEKHKEKTEALEMTIKKLEATDRVQSAVLENTLKRLEDIEKSLKEVSEAAQQTKLIDLVTTPGDGEFIPLAKSRKRRFASLETIAPKRKK